eukprot:7765003-Alexandrium_andersonii.AAC.1
MERRALARGVRDASSMPIGRPSWPPFGGRPGCLVGNGGARLLLVQVPQLRRGTRRGRRLHRPGAR